MLPWVVVPPLVPAGVVVALEAIRAVVEEALERAGAYSAVAQAVVVKVGAAVVPCQVDMEASLAMVEWLD